MTIYTWYPLIPLQDCSTHIVTHCSTPQVGQFGHPNNIVWLIVTSCWTNNVRQFDPSLSVICLMQTPAIPANFINSALTNLGKKSIIFTGTISKHFTDIFLVLSSQISVSAILKCVGQRNHFVLRGKNAGDFELLWLISKSHDSVVSGPELGVPYFAQVSTTFSCLLSYKFQ